jgi:hypothetical protein
LFAKKENVAHPIFHRLNNIIGHYLEALQDYTVETIKQKPSPASWSIGQLYTHLIDDTTFYIGQIEESLSSNDNQSKGATDFAKTLLRNNEFPNEKIKGAPDNDRIPQPDNIEVLEQGLKKLQHEFARIEKLISTSEYGGKSKHPGFGYLTAMEWLQLAEMHLRHHLRQKKRIDDKLRD